MQKETLDRWIELLKESDGVFICTTKKIDEDNIEMDFILHEISYEEIGEMVNYLTEEHPGIIQYTNFGLHPDRTVPLSRGN